MVVQNSRNGTTNNGHFYAVHMRRHPCQITLKSFREPNFTTVIRTMTTYVHGKRILTAALQEFLAERSRTRQRLDTPLNR